MVSYKYDVVSEKRTVEIECLECRLIRTRVLKAFQTINPFNKNADGSYKSASDIRKELPRALDKQERELQAKPFICHPCKRDIEEDEE